MKHETVQASAFQMFDDASIEFGDNGENAKTAPFRMVARTGEPIDHPYWGKIAHDLEGFTLSGPTGRNRISVDYVHDDKSVIGYANHFDTSSGDLVVSGALVPFKEGDRASEVIFKGKNGVPFEASINFAGDKTVLERVGDDETSVVNGKEFVGPGVIVRQWQLRSVAVCPSGADSGTSTELFSGADKVRVSFLENEEITEMAQQIAVKDGVLVNEKFTAVAEVESPEKESTVEANAETDSGKSVVVAEVVPTIDVEPPKETTPMNAEVLSSLSEGERMLQDFGDKGAVLHVKGVSYSEAAVALFKEQRGELAELKLKITDLESQLVSPSSYAATFSNPKEKQVDDSLPITIRR